MTPEAQRIAIAEACGYERDDHGTGIHWHDRNCGMDVCYIRDLPCYPSDLNAMHEAEKHIHFNEIGEYIEQLGKIVRAYWIEGGKDVERFDTQSVIMAHAHATAAQRAEAFLRTLNLWDDTK